MAAEVRPRMAAPLARPRATLLHDFFEAVAGATPGHLALDIPPGVDHPDRRQLTYRALSARASMLGAPLRAFADREFIAAIVLPRWAPDAYAAILAILRAGGAFVSIDPSFPASRVGDILFDAEPAVVFTNAAGARTLSSAGIRAPFVIDVDEMAGPHAEIGDIVPTVHDPSGLAYVIYTSGTTGRPKGVMVEHCAIVNLIASDVDEFGLSSGDRVGQSSSHAYDSSIEEIWLAWSASATVVVLDDEVVRRGPDLIDWLNRETITVLSPPPTLLRTTGCRSAAETPLRLRLLYVGGETLTRDLADVWAPGRRLVNGYGPTECAVTAMRADVASSGLIGIGRPVPGVSAWILDTALEPVPDGTPGELCLGGVALARGYQHLAELTAERFPTHPTCGRIYRTGDIAHRESDGTFVFHGRADSQVKIRGYRVELEEIDAHASALPDVVAAACRVDGDAAGQTLSAFIVPRDPQRPPARTEIRSALARSLPRHMIPSRIAFVDRLPTTAGGKLDRAALPPRDDGRPHTAAPFSAPTNLEAAIESRVCQVLGLDGPVAPDADLFGEMGLDSLRTAQLVTALREDARFATVATRDVYEARTIRALAAEVGTSDETSAAVAHAVRRLSPVSAGAWPMATTLTQVSWLAARLILGSGAAAAVYLVGLTIPDAWSIWVLAATPLLTAAAAAAWIVISIAIAVAVKRTLIGTYRSERISAWTGRYVRHWIIERTAHSVPWRILEGTELQSMVLRLLGARIGRRVHIGRGVDLSHGAWDLLDVGDDVTLGRDASIRVVDLRGGHVVLAPITIEADTTVDVRGSVGGGAWIGRGAFVTMQSSVGEGARVGAGERWDGVPASPAGLAPHAPAVRPGAPRDARDLTPGAHAAIVLLFRLGGIAGRTIPYVLVAALALAGSGGSIAHVAAWLASPTFDVRVVAWLALLALTPVPIGLAARLLAMRALGPVPAGTMGCRSWRAIRLAARTRMVESAGVWLSGSLLWPRWLRAAGMRVGRGCEISSILDVSPEHVSIGDGSFLTDGVYLGAPRVERGAITIEPTSLGPRVFVGNHAVIPCGQTLARDTLIGVSTVADGRRMAAGTSWFGHPPFELAGRRAEPMDRRLTDSPTRIRVVTRTFWELLRFSLPAARTAIELTWLLVVTTTARISIAGAIGIAAPVAAAAGGVALALVVLALKWVLLGRVSPGRHGFWSCWCGRWDFLYVAWERLALPVLAPFDGTLVTAWYLRAMGATIGRRVLFAAGFAHVVDPDMLDVADDATVQALLQAHTFEDRVLKIDRIHIREAATIGDHAVLLYGVDVCEHAFVSANSVVMKGERLGPGEHEGNPTRPGAPSASHTRRHASTAARHATSMTYNPPVT